MVTRLFAALILVLGTCLAQTVSPPTPSSSSTPSGPCGGDLSGTYPNCTVVGINSTLLSGLATGLLKNTTTTGVPFISKVTLTEPATAATLTLANNSSLITSGAFSTTLTSAATTVSTLPAGTHSLAPLDSPSFTTPSLGVATATSLAVNCTLIGEFCVGSTSTSVPRGITSGQWTTSTDSARFNGYKARGTQATPTTVVTADFLTRWSGYGYDSANYIESASVVMGTEGTIAATRVPSYLSLQTSTDATPSVMTERLKIDSAGLSSFTGTVKISSLTSGRIPFAGTGGLLGDSGNLTWDGSTGLRSDKPLKVSGNAEITAASVFAWAPAADPSTAPDTGLSRCSAGLVCVGTGAQGSVAGSLSMATLTLSKAGASPTLLTMTNTTGSVSAFWNWTSGSILQFYTDGGTIPGITLNAANLATFAGAVVNSYTSLVSSPASLYTGSWYTGGSATTTKPHFLIEPTGTASTAWNTTGTAFGINAASGYAGVLAEMQVAAVSKFTVTAAGNVNAAGTITASANLNTSATFQFGSKTKLYGNGTDGVMGILTNASTGVNVDVQTAGTLKVLTTAGADTAILAVNKGNFGWSGFGTASQSTSSVLDTSGRVYMNALTTSASLQVAVMCIGTSGEVVQDSVACVASGGRYKQNITSLSPADALKFIMASRPVEYEYRPEFNGVFQSNPNYSGRQVGFIADEVHLLDPRLTEVTIQPSEFMGITYPAGTAQTVRYQNLTAVLTAAMQAQQRQIQTLEDKISRLEAR